MIVSRQACASGVGDSTVVDLEAHLPYDMRTETAIALSLARGEGGTLNCAPSADTVAGNGAPLSWRPSAVADAGNGPPLMRRPSADAVAPRLGWGRQAPH
jgi:hypothetical protein